jgi:hypothetical protein
MYLASSSQLRRTLDAFLEEKEIGSFSERWSMIPADLEGDAAVIVNEWISAVHGTLPAPFRTEILQYYTRRVRLTPEDASTLSDVLSSEEDPELLREGIEVLSASSDGVAQTRLCHLAVGSRDPSVRMEAARALGVYPKEEGRSALATIIQHDPQSSVRIVAIQSLLSGAPHDRVLVQDLRAFLQAECDPEVRCEILRAHLQISPVSGAAELEAWIPYEGDSSLRARIAYALLRLREEAADLKTFAAVF